MLEHGVYLAPSQFEAGFVSFAHSDEDDPAHGGDDARVLQFRKNLTAEKTTTAPKNNRLKATVARRRSGGTCGRARQPDG